MKYFSNRSQNCQWENFCVSSLDVCLATRSVSREAVTNSREVGYCLDRSGHTSTSWNKGPGHSLTMANVALIFETPLSSVFNALDVSTGSRGDNSFHPCYCLPSTINPRVICCTAGHMFDKCTPLNK